MLMVTKTSSKAPESSKFVPVEKSLLHVTADKRQVALERCQSYTDEIADYLAVKDKIPFGLDLTEVCENNKRRILEVLGGSESDWHDWRWQMRHTISSVDVLREILPLSNSEIEQIRKTEKKYRWGVSPYYASLMDREDRKCPVRMQGIPSILEIQDSTVETDPETVQYNSPAPLITRLYPDRLIINVTNACTMFCRHCLRRRHIAFENVIYAESDVQMALDYVREHKEIRDVLITGGDALCLSDERIDWILTELGKMPHVEVKRLGSRTLAVLPMRVTQELCEILKKHRPVYLNTQFNHSREITQEAARATDMLTQAGVLLGNQAVLLRGINSDRHVMKKLMQDLLRISVRPYYIFNCKKLEGINHFRASIEDGLNIMEYLRNYTSGLAVPTYICTLPNGRGKTPVMPQYLLNINADGKARFRSWQGFVVDYEDAKRDPDGLAGRR
jgi:lysine 2,3-aminomutase